MATASGDSVSGTQVGGQTSVNGGTNHQNGPVATSRDDISSINAAQQDALTLPDDKGTRRGKLGKIWGNPAPGLLNQALPGNKDGGY